MRGLIVTADDFGAAPEVNEAVEIAHRQGVLSAASLMVGAPAVEDAVKRARANPRLRVGLHLVLVEGRPVSSPEDVPDLIDGAGRFRTDMARTGAAMFFLPHVRRQLAHEIDAQFAAFAATGLQFDHVNAHKHFHLHPTIADMILRAGARYGVSAARSPCERYDVLSAIEPGPPSGVERLVAPFASALAARMRRAGWLIPDQVFGLRWTGAMIQGRLTGVLQNAPAGLTEIYLHPATSDRFEGAAPGYRYADELTALCAPQALALAENFKRGGFADFQIGAGEAKSSFAGEAA